MRIFAFSPSVTLPPNATEFVMTSVVSLAITLSPPIVSVRASASEPPPVTVRPPFAVHGMLQWTAYPAVSTVRPPAPMV